ncbi:phage tail tape measure protein [Salibacterium aidingense]|uniref:phage tail tape measure protein n=1 Tax=Salibacterium aidingense TaxID=384933 RepID=UPI003BE9EC1F
MADGKVIIDALFKKDKAEKDMKGFQKSMQNVGKRAKTVGKNMTKYVTAPLAAIGAAGFAAANELDKAYKDIQTATGATGDSLEGLKDDFKTVFKDVPNSADEVSGALGNLNTLTGATGHTLQDLTKSVLDASRSLGEDGVANSQAFGQAMQQWQIPAEEGPAIMDKLFVATQDYGVGLGDLTGYLNKYGSVLQNAGFTMDESADLFGRLEASGLSVSRVMPGLNMAFRNWADEGKNSREEFQKTIEKMQDAETETEALAIATEEFGAEGAQRLTTAIRNGTIPSLDELGDALEGSEGAVQKNAEETMTFGEKLQQLKNKAMVGLEPVGRIMLDLAEQYLPPLINTLETVVGWFADLSPAGQKAVMAFGAVAAAAGPVITVAGSLASVIGTVSGAIAGAGGLSAVLGGLAAAGGPITLAVGAIAGLTAGGIALYNEMSKSALETERFSNDVSESTQKAVGSYLDLDEEATVALNQLAWSQQEVTDEMANDLISTYDQMGDQIIKEMEADHKEQLSTTQDFFARSQTLTEKEEAEIVEAVKESQEEQTQEVRDGKDRIEEILKNAAEENRAITEEEKQEINQIQTEMKDTAIEVMSESEAEQKAIHEQLKQESGKITAEQAAEVVQNAKEQKDQVVSEAEEQYDDAVAEIIRMRDESGVISEEQADKLIAEAEKQRDETVQNAEEMHENVVREAQEQAGEHVDKVDWETGEVLSKWEVFKNNVGNTWENIKSDASQKWDNMTQDVSRATSNIVNNAGEALNDLKSGFSSKLEEVKSTVSGWKDDIVGFFSNMNLSIPTPSLPDLPHFSIETSSRTIMGKEITYPTGFDVSWYEDGGIFPANSPRLIGIGDASVPEAALPLNDQTLGTIASMISSHMDPGDGSGGDKSTVINQTIHGMEPGDVQRETQRALRREATEWAVRE